MRPVSNRFKAEVYKSRRRFTEAAALTPAGPIPIPIVDGSINLDESAETRASLDLTTPSRFAPTSSTDPLTTYGGEVQLWQGMEYLDGVREKTSVGIFRIKNFRHTRQGVQFVGLDRSSRIRESSFEEACSVREKYGVLLVDAIKNMILEVYPECQFRAGTSAFEVPADYVVEEDDDRWEACMVCAEALGCLVYFDADGYCLIRPVTQPTIASAEITPGTGQALLDAVREWDSTNTKNRWKVYGSSTKSEEPGGATPVGVAVDDNPLSPTRYGGPMGKLTDTPWTNEAIVNNAGAQNSAEIRKAKLAGVTQNAPLDLVPNPALEPYDVAHLREPGVGLDLNVVISSLSLPFKGGSMSGTTRSVLVPQ